MGENRTTSTSRPPDRTREQSMTAATTSMDARTTPATAPARLTASARLIRFEDVDRLARCPELDHVIAALRR